MVPKINFLGDTAHILPVREILVNIGKIYHDSFLFKIDQLLPVAIRQPGGLIF